MKEKQKNNKKPETFVSHQHKAVKLFTEIKRINSKYIEEIRPKIEKDISNLFNKEKPDEKAISLLNKLLRTPTDSNHDEMEGLQFLIGNIVEKMQKENIHPQSNKMAIFLSDSADLYRDPKDKYIYRMEKGSIRHKIVSLLMNQKTFLPSEDIQGKVGCESYGSFTDAIGKINKNAQKLLNLSSVQNLIISKRLVGYMINDLYKILPE